MVCGGHTNGSQAPITYSNCKAQSFARMDQATSTNLYSIIMNSNGKGQRLDLAQVYEFLAQVDLAQV